MVNLYTLSLEIAHECNLNCRYCYLGAKKNKVMNSNMAKEAVDMSIKEVLKQKDKTLDVYFIGGEPLLKFDLIKEIVEYVKTVCNNWGLNYSFSTTTNGTLLNKEIMDYLIGERFDLKISIDGKEEFHDLNRKYYSGKGSFKDILSKWELIEEYEKKLNTVIHAAQVITVNNVQGFVENFKALVEMGFRYIETDINKYDNWDQATKEILSQQIEEAIDYYISSTKKGAIYYWRMFEMFLQDYFNNLPFYQCKAGANSMFITVDGVIYPCQECKKMDIGTMTDKTININKIRQLIHIEKTRNEKCINCEYLAHCRVHGCVMDNMEFNNDIYKPVDINCFLTKLVLNKIDTYFTKNEKKKMEVVMQYERAISSF